MTFRSTSAHRARCRSQAGRVGRWVWIVAACCGCHLIGGQQPVSKQEAASRQLSQSGISLLEQGKWDDGEKKLAAAIKACPGDPEPHHHYAEAYWHRGDKAGGLAEMLETIRLNGDDPSLMVRRRNGDRARPCASRR